jgi:anti-sigma factor RsiW
MSDDRDMLLNAYFDGELDAVAARHFETRLAVEPDLAGDLARLKRLRTRLHADIAEDVPSAALRRQIARRFASPPWMRPQTLQSLAAALVVGVAIGSAGTIGALPPRPADTTADQVVAGHIRALMAPSPADVASSDHHTVKPWFDGKVPFAPQVIELASAGFPLIGGRVDVVGLKPVPAMVYGAGKHLISLIEMPSETSAAAPVTRRMDRGYEAVSWTENRVTFWAVSDASDEEMQAFVKALRAAINPM